MAPVENPRRLARIGGALYLAIIIIGLIGEAVIRAGVVVPGDAAATAANLRSMESLWRLGIAAEIVLLICATALAIILYTLFRPADGPDKSGGTGKPLWAYQCGRTRPDPLPLTTRWPTSLSS